MNASQLTRPETPVVALRFDGQRFLKRALFCLFFLEVALVIADGTLNHAGWLPHDALRRFFNMTREDALGSFVAVTQTFLLGMTLVAIAVLDNARAGEKRTFGWVILAAFFTYLAIDDGTMLHERVGTAIEDGLLSDGPLAWFPSYGWQVAFVPLFGTMGLYVAWFVWKNLDDALSHVLVVGSIGLLAVAVGMDFVEGMDKEDPFNVLTAVGSLEGVESLARAWFDQSGYAALLHFSKSFEEAFEMMAMSTLWYVFASHLVRQMPLIQLDLEPDAP